MALDIPRAVLAALWAPHAAEAPGTSTLKDASTAVRGEADDDGEAGLGTPAMLAQVAGTAVIAVLPEPGNPVRLPAAARSAAMQAGQALLSGPPGGAAGVLRVAVPIEREFGSVFEPGELLTWEIHSEPVDGGGWVPPVLSLSEARTEVAQALTLAIETLTRMDVARWREEAAEEIAMLAGNTLPSHVQRRLPRGLDGRRLEVLSRALRLRAIVELARQDDGAAVNAWQADQRTAALRHVAAAARTALSAVSVSGF